MKRLSLALMLITAIACSGCQTQQVVAEPAPNTYSLPAIHREAHKKLLSEQQKLRFIPVLNSDHGYSE